MAYRPQAVTIDDRAVEHLVEFCRSNSLDQLFMVADNNTFAAQGKAVRDALLAAGVGGLCPRRAHWKDAAAHDRA